MSHTSTEVAPVAVEVPDDASALTEPTFEAMSPNAENTCDRHPSTYALVYIVLPSGNDLMMCGNCARIHFGYEHTKHSVPENKTQGSAN